MSPTSKVGGVDDAARLLTSLRQRRFHPFEMEGDLHQEIMAECARLGIAFKHEVKLGPRCRIDFVIGNVGIEVKTGILNRRSVTAQLERYKKCDLDRIILIAEQDLRPHPDGVEVLALHHLWGIV